VRDEKCRRFQTVPAGSSRITTSPLCHCGVCPRRNRFFGKNEEQQQQPGQQQAAPGKLERNKHVIVRKERKQR